MFKNIPPVTRNLLFINIIVFMVQALIMQRTDDVLTSIFGLHFFKADEFRLWQLVTYMFLHGSWTHVLLNMFSLWMFGRIIEQTMGARRFLIYYFICGIGAGLCQELWQLGEYLYSGMYQYDSVSTEFGVLPMSSALNAWVTIGASGACYGVLLAFGMTFPEERIMLLIPPIPMKGKYFVMLYAAIELWSAFSSNGNVAHFAHLGGMFFGWLYFLRCRRLAHRQRTANPWDSYTRAADSPSFFQRIRNAVLRVGASLENAVRSLFDDKGNRSGSGGNHFGNPANGQHTHRHSSSQQSNYRNSDHEFNAQKRAQQQRIDEILDKVRRSGYASLTEEEKRDLFNHSKKS